MTQTCIIVGAGHAAAQLAPSLRQEGWEGNILIISDEPYIPYHRPPLSKALLAGEKNLSEILIRPEAIYEKHNIHFRLSTRVESIQPTEKTITLHDGEQLAYDKLALCTGSRVRKMPIGAGLAGVHYLRNIQDVEAIKADIHPHARAVIIGGGYIGLETAAVLKKLGLQVTVVEMMDRVLQRVASSEVSEFYTRVHAEEGVRIETGKVVGAIEADPQAQTAHELTPRELTPRVQQVICTDNTRYDADLVIIGVGVVPNTELAETAGLAVDNGIVVDELARTEDPHIVAAGDCTNHPNKLLGYRLRLESVPNATDQAKTAAASICGKQKPYCSLPWFWSDQYDMKLQIAGFNQGYDKVVLRGDNQTGRGFVAWYLRAGKLLAADCVNRPKEFMLAKQLLSKNLPVTPEQLADESFELKSLLRS